MPKLVEPYTLTAKRDPQSRQWVVTPAYAGKDLHTWKRYNHRAEKAIEAAKTQEVHQHPESEQP